MVTRADALNRSFMVCFTYTHRKCYILVYTNSNKSGFRRIFVFGTRFNFSFDFNNSYF